MGQINKPRPVKLITGFIFKDEAVLAKAKAGLKKRFGRIDFESRALAFTHTGYYEKEFGKGLKRQFVSFKKLIFPDELPRIKIIANNIERKLSLTGGARLINIDPGYLNYAKLVLASSKDYSHRIYLSKGIHAEITLLYQNKTFLPLVWTYPDYRTPEYIAIFAQIREIYASQA
jgi:hypothetical protein